MIYQEQVMQIVRDLGGYSYARADLVRKAMSKKKWMLWKKNGNTLSMVKRMKMETF